MNLTAAITRAETSADLRRRKRLVNMVRKALQDARVKEAKCGGKLPSQEPSEVLARRALRGARKESRMRRRVGHALRMPRG